MTAHWKPFLAMAVAFCIVSLASFAAGFDISPDKKYLWCASARFCPSLNFWQSIALLAALSVLCTPWGRINGPLRRSIRASEKHLRFLALFGRVVSITVCNMFFTALNFLCCRPVASAICIGLGVVFNGDIQHGWNFFFNLSRWQRDFVFLFVFKFLKVVVHSISYMSYRPQLPSAKSAAYNAKDVTVIIPSIDNFGAAFTRCVRSVLECKPAQVFIATVESKREAAERVCREISMDLKVITVKEANKRAQFLEAALMRTSISVIGRHALVGTASLLSCSWKGMYGSSSHGRCL